MMRTIRSLIKSIEQFLACAYRGRYHLNTLEGKLERVPVALNLLSEVMAGFIPTIHVLLAAPSLPSPARGGG
jgi:hypothetical protein